MIVAVRTLRDARKSLLWWSLAVVSVSLLMIGLYPSIEGQVGLAKTFEQLPAAIRAMMGTPGGMSIISATGYVHGRIFATIAPLLLTIFGIGHGARSIGGAEREGTLELLLSNPVSRRRVVGERFVVVVVLVLVLGAVMASSVAVLCKVVGGSLAELSTGRILAGFVGATCLALLFATIAFAVGCATGNAGRAMAVASAIAVGSYLIQLLTLTLPWLDWLGSLSPWRWYLERVILLHGLHASALFLPLGCGAVVAAVGVAIFLRRDLR